MQGGPPLASRQYFPTLHRVGRQVVQVVDSGPTEHQNVIYLTLLSALAHAERTIHLTTAYFVPDPQFLEVLVAARRRGVAVTLVLPGLTDSPMALAAQRARYQVLLDAGVAIYERRDVMLHAKTVVIDGVWSTVGSANVDQWSFDRNEEVNAVILGVDFARQMETMFQADLAASVPVDPWAWAHRPLPERLWEGFAGLWRNVL